jgi:malate dehydrogenase (oxaloacetate-decarboxylating)
MLLLSGVPILLATRDPHETVRTRVHIAPTFAAIVLEGIAVPGCYAVEEALSTQLSQPVWHDDQHGVAVVVLTALLTLAMQTQEPHTRIRVGLVGLGVSGIGIAKLLHVAGVRQLWGTDPHDNGCQRLTQLGGTATTVEEVMREAEVIVVTSAAPGFRRPDLVRRGQTLLALSSFSPELEEAARAAEARYVADDQRLTTALVFPGIIRGALDACRTRITDAMKIAAAVAIMRHCRGTDLLPSVLDPAPHLHVAHAVQDCATREQTEPVRVKGP